MRPGPLRAIIQPWEQTFPSRKGAVTQMRENDYDWRELIEWLLDRMDADTLRAAYALLNRLFVSR